MIAGRCVVSRRPRLSSLNYTELLLAVFRGVVSPFEADAEIRDRSVMKRIGRWARIPDGVVVP